MNSAGLLRHSRTHRAAVARVAKKIAAKQRRRIVLRASRWDIEENPGRYRDAMVALRRQVQERHSVGRGCMVEMVDPITCDMVVTIELTGSCRLFYPADLIKVVSDEILRA